MSDIINIYNKFKFAKIDIPALVNNTILFILAWEGVFWFFQLFTVIPAFSLGVKMRIFNSEIDFNSVNTTVSQNAIWQSADNINSIFLTPVIMSIILSIVAVLFLIKWNSDRLNMRRFLFWIILCATIRVGGNFICGHIFNTWNWNLVTDFMGITYPSRMAKYLLCVEMLCVVFITFWAMSGQIKLLFYPYFANRINNLISNIFLPVCIGMCVLFLLDLPRLPITEIGNFVLMFVAVVFFICRPFVRKYRGIAEEFEGEDEESVNKIPILILFFVILINCILMHGKLIESSPYRSFLLENIIMVSVLICLGITLILSIVIYNRRSKAVKTARIQEILEIDRTMRELSEKDKQQVQNIDKYNMDKYKVLQNQDEQESLNDTKPQQADDKHDDLYGFKTYNLDKYNKRNWK